jgi:uncharacterized membrane protein
MLATVVVGAGLSLSDWRSSWETFYLVAAATTALTGPLALVFASIARRGIERVDTPDHDSRSLANAGFITGLLLTFVVLLVVFTLTR